MKSAAVVEAVVDRVDDGDKEKKKRRSRNRRAKQVSPVSGASDSPVNELSSEVSGCSENGTTANHVTTPPTKQQLLEMNPLNVQGSTTPSKFAFNSLPTMHIVESSPDVQSPGPENKRFLRCDFDGRNSCPQPDVSGGGSPVIFANKGSPHPLLGGYSQPAVSGGSPGIFVNKGSPLQQVGGYSPVKFFTPHWSMMDVNDALKKGDAFKALFHVNAHNRIEAYCKIDGLPTDVLIGGLVEQNRAVEGDIVAIKIDPLPYWTRIKGSAGSCKSPAPVEDLNLNLESNASGNNCKGEAKVDEGCEYDSRGSCLLPQRGSHPEESTFIIDSVHSDPVGQSTIDHVAGKYPLASDSSEAGSSSEQNVDRTPVERMCAIINSCPSKRPTGRVVAIIEKSQRRDTVIGYLNVRKWLSYREVCRKDVKRRMPYPDYEYIQMTPTDPRFPKMVVLVRNLPDSIKKRLEDGDQTIEKELCAARVDEWSEESPAPQASILHAFGQGTEVQPHIEAILFQNAIDASDFSPESLSCLPSLPWEVPRKEFKKRKDLRNLCIFTIDPSTATDLDDALSIENFSDGIFRVGVHIADASYFVLPETPLDKEAQSRSTSVYMTQRKVPMLPPLLSENVGSLNPGIERLAFSVFLDINLAGDVVDRWVGHTVIRSCCKLSYEHAQDIIDGKFDSVTYGDGCPQVHGHFKWMNVISSVKNLYEMSKSLKERRFSDGALQLDSSKVVIMLDEFGDPYDSLFSERKESNSLVEEFMLLANRTAAEVISRAFPDSALLRRHPEPNMRKLKEFEAFCSKHGLELNTSSSGDLCRSLERIKEKLKDDSVLFNILMNYATRPMQLATYFCSGELKDKESDWSHYGLAVPLYTHFTSPLRRYPDIVVHRTLAAAIEAEELYMKHRGMLNGLNRAEESKVRCFTGVQFDKDTAESKECQEVLLAAAMKHKIPSSELLAGVAAYCNDRKLASRHVKDACDKLHIWSMLRKKESLISEARVMGLGPKFMSIYIQKLAVERRINYDEVEGLMVEWLDATSTLVLSLGADKRSFRRGSPGKWRALEDVALVVSPYDLEAEPKAVGKSYNESSSNGCSLSSEIEPMVFPLTVRLLSTIRVVLHAVGGDDGPVDFGARLYMSSYLS